MSDEVKPTEGRTAAEKLHALRFPGVDVSGVPDRALTDEERDAAVRDIRDATSAKQWVSTVLGFAVKLGAKFLAG